jgi:hypothetical protein
MARKSSHNQAPLSPWREYFGRWTSMAIIVPSLLIGFFSPTDILDRSPSLRSFCEHVATLFPVVLNYANVSHFPQVSTLYFAIELLLAPLAFFWVALSHDPHREKIARNTPITRKERIHFIILIPLTVITFYFSYFKNPGMDFSIIPFNSSRIALALLGFLGSGVPAFMMAAVAYRFYQFKIKGK